MARITLEQAKDMNSYESEWFKLEPGAAAVVQFFGNNDADIDAYPVHPVDFEGFNYGRDVHCLRGYDDPADVCPLCAANIQRKTAIQLAMINVDTKKVHIWSRGPGKGNAFANKLQSMFNRYQPINKKLFLIERWGEGLDTTYDISRYEEEDIQPLDLDKFTKPDTEKSLLKVTAEQMNEYLDTGKWNLKSDDDDSSQPQQRRRQQSQPTQQQSQRRRRG